MALAPAPDNVMAQGPDAMSRAKKAARVVDDTPEYQREIRRMLKVLHWHYHKQQLDLLRMACPSDDQYALYRDKSLALINEGERALVQAVLNVTAGETR